LGENGTGGAAWTAVVFGADRVTVAEVARPPAGRPQVLACETFARAGSELETLKRLRKSRRLGRGRCTTLLGEGEYQLVQIDVPANAAQLAPAELREALRWRLKEMVSFPVERAGIDLVEIPGVGGRPPQLWVAIASHDVLQPRIRLFQDARIDLAAIDIPDLTQRNLAGLFEEASRGLVLLCFDHRGGRLTVSFRGELYMTRHIEAGAADLVAGDAGALHERVLLDIQRSLDNFDRNYSAISLTRLVVGPLPGGEAFFDYLRANLALPLVEANLAEAFDCGAAADLTDCAAQAEGWLALGAALRD